jgi:hypothetical protein
MNDPVFEELRASLGGKVFAVFVQNTALGELRCVFTSHPGEYPAADLMPLDHSAWTLQVLVEGEAFVANSVAEFAGQMRDYERLVALGAGAALSIPVGNDAGDVLGAVAMFDDEGSFDEIRVFAIQAMVVARQGRLADAMRNAVKSLRVIH